MPSKINLIHGDCMDLRRNTPDKFYDLAILDPPYGGGMTDAWKGKTRSRFGGIFDKYDIKATRTGGRWNEKYYAEGESKTKTTHWDIAPSIEYFDELARVSKNQIIWGGNYFLLPPTRCFLVWRKLTISESFTMAMCEYAWTSFNDNAKWIEIAPQGTKGNVRFHPTQKPVKLYQWVLQNYAKQGFKILDTHLGSGSIAIACYDIGFDLTATEIDADYYQAALKRFDNHCKQGRLDF